MTPANNLPRTGGAKQLQRITRRRALSALAVGVVAPGVLASCVSKSGRQDEAAGPPPKPTVTLRPGDSADDVVPTAPISAEVRDGFFQRVTLTNSDGTVVAGALSRDRTSYSVTEPLGYGQKYTWSGSVVGRDGIAVPVEGRFSTVEPDSTVHGQFQLADGQTVGVAAPVILQFDASISDKAAVERALNVVTQPPVEGGWAWLPDEAEGSRVHWRTREYYPAGTTVHVDAKLYGVNFGDGAFGAEDVSLNFTVGRRQVVKGHAPSHRIQVETDEGVIMDFPCSYGEADLPRNVTRSGTHVVSEKYEDFWMSNPAAGYANVHERYAVRISNNGEFIHCNPESIGAQGNTNVSNGCINLNLENAREYFNSAIYGDPVEINGTSVELSYADGDIWDWAVDWDSWRAMSALTPEASPASIPSTAPATPSGAPQPVNGRPGG